MKTNAAGIALIQSFEKCVLTAYLDAGGVPTIGWGAVGPGIGIGTVWTQAEADERFARDVAFCEGIVSHFVEMPLTENEFSALVSFVFNEGSGHFYESTLLQFLNEGAAGRAQAADQFLRWVKVNGEINAGLVRRRTEEWALFLAP